MLIVGLVATLMVRPLADKWLMSDAESAQEMRLAQGKSATTQLGFATDFHHNNEWSTMKVGLAWALVGIPLAWGIYRTLVAVRQVLQLSARTT